MLFHFYFKRNIHNYNINFTISIFSYSVYHCYTCLFYKPDKYFTFFIDFILTKALSVIKHLPKCSNKKKIHHFPFADEKKKKFYRAIKLDNSIKKTFF